MLLLLSLMTEKSFLTSERLLTSKWTNIFYLTSLTRRIYCFLETRPKSQSFTWRKDWEKEVGGQGVRIRRRVSKPPLLSVLLANVQSLENKLDDLRLRLSYQRDIENCSILCFTKSWLNDEMDNIELADFYVFQQDKAATSGKRRSRGVSLFVNNCWSAMSNINEVLRYCSPEVEYLMISCRPHDLPR